MKTINIGNTVKELTEIFGNDYIYNNRNRLMDPYLNHYSYFVDGNIEVVFSVNEDYDYCTENEMIIFQIMIFFQDVKIIMYH